MNIKPGHERGFFRLTIILSIFAWVISFTIGIIYALPRFHFFYSFSWKDILFPFVVASMIGIGIWMVYWFIKYVIIRAIKYIMAGFKKEE